jgi:hypothetical protein
MCIVPPLQRLASASVVFFGRHGDVTASARQRQLSRQCLYRQADKVLRDLDPGRHLRQIDLLRQQRDQLQLRLASLQLAQSRCVELGPDAQAHFAACAQAEGVSLPVARRLLAVFLGDATPSVAQLGRLSRAAALRSAALLEVLDEQARPRVRQAAADEIFFGRKPALMLVEPHSQCWLAGRLSPSRDAEQWAGELRRLPQLEHLVRDGARGIKNGLAALNAQRRAEQQRQQEPISDQLDHFHSLREGRRALSVTQRQAEQAWSAAEAAERKQERQRRKVKSERGHATAALLAWRKAEQAFRRWESEESVFEQIRAALRPCRDSGELNTRQRAEQEVKGLLARLSGERWDKFKRLLSQPESYSYLDRLQAKVQALAVSAEVREAVVLGEAVRQNPALAVGEGARPALMRGLMVVCGVLIGLAAQAGQQAVAALRQALRDVGRASSCVEGVNSVLRMQQRRHRKMSQELLDLKRLYWNLRKFRTGRRKKTSPYERLGVPLPPGLGWWQLLQLTPDQLRSLLSAPANPP